MNELSYTVPCEKWCQWLSCQELCSRCPLCTDHDFQLICSALFHPYTPHWGNVVLHFSGNKNFQNFDHFGRVLAKNRQNNKNWRVWISGKLYYCLAPVCTLISRPPAPLRSRKPSIFYFVFFCRAEMNKVLNFRTKVFICFAEKLTLSTKPFGRTIVVLMRFLYPKEWCKITCLIMYYVP